MADHNSDNYSDERYEEYGDEGAGEGHGDESERSGEIEFGRRGEHEGSREGHGKNYEDEEDSGMLPSSLEAANDKMISDIEHLIETIENKVEGYKDLKEKEKIQRRQEDPIYDRDDELQTAQFKATKIKNEIKTMKKALFTAYDIDGIIRDENELKRLQKEADGLETEALSLRKVKNANKLAMRELDADSNMNHRFKKSKNSLNEIKNTLKERQEVLRIEERNAQAEHNQIVRLQER